jgi:class 3 adenylate cyclase
MRSLAERMRVLHFDKRGTGCRIEVRSGLHTGEVETIDGKAGGIAVSIGARVCGLAGPSEVLASRTVRVLVAGSGLGFADRGEHGLKGVPGTWELFSVSG